MPWEGAAFLVMRDYLLYCGGRGLVYAYSIGMIIVTNDVIVHS
jgi:hypothetical protein